MSCELSANHSPSIFPVNADHFARHCEQMGQRDLAQAMAAIASNQFLESETTPTGHLMRLNEYWGMRRPWVDMDVPIIDRIVQRYRLGVWLGRSFADQELRYANRQRDVPLEVRVDPEREYLRFPARCSSATMREYAALAQWDGPSTYYMRKLVEENFFTDMSVAHRLGDLGHQWGETMGSLLRPEDGELPDFLFGEVCHGLRDTFHLYRILKAEERVAPRRSVTFDAAVHVAADERSHQFDPSLVGRRFPVGGFRCQDGTVGWGDESVPRDTPLTEVYRGIGGYVRLEETARGGLRKVVFAKSIQSFVVEGDGLSSNVTLRNNRGDYLNLPDPPVLPSRLEGDYIVNAVWQDNQSVILGELPPDFTADYRSLGLLSPLSVGQVRAILNGEF